MEKKKIPYESPRTELTQVELENPICSGSVEVANPQGDLGQINEQTVNTDFSSDAFKSGTWEEVTQ